MELLETPPKGLTRFEICTACLAAYLCLAVLCLFLETDRLEADLHGRVDAVLERAPLQWHAVDIDGQTAVVSGVVAADQDAAQLRDLVLAVPGVARVHDQFESVTDDGLCQSRLDVFLARASITFEPGSDVLKPQSQDGIERMAAVIRHCAPRVEVGAHTATKGDAALNQSLSERRAAMLVRSLVRAGVVEPQLIARGFGETQPLAAGASPAADAGNERVTFRVRGKAA